MTLKVVGQCETCSEDATIQIVEKLSVIGKFCEDCCPITMWNVKLLEKEIARLKEIGWFDLADEAQLILDENLKRGVV